MDEQKVRKAHKVAMELGEEISRQPMAEHLVEMVYARVFDAMLAEPFSNVFSNTATPAAMYDKQMVDETKTSSLNSD